MARPSNTTESDTVQVTLSVQSVELLRKLAALGIYGRSPAEVAARFVDAALDRFAETPRFKLDGENQGRASKT